ncbi:hypothetical protein SBOR_8618 [Sclerotinia borealis F-4128]|uniref:Uncharacterized protein n=1 Tax=Sclerotinia borealis (strain F-4128) TaxID=1432307 RepID=W9C7Y1_SCLBF|nr:hypothetical protein SBOR_8618 [Sclerotinia borealis F-4128]
MSGSQSEQQPLIPEKIYGVSVTFANIREYEAAVYALREIKENSEYAQKRDVLNAKGNAMIETLNGKYSDKLLVHNNLLQSVQSLNNKHGRDGTTEEENEKLRNDMQMLTATINARKDELLGIEKYIKRIKKAQDCRG